MRKTGTCLARRSKTLAALLLVVGVCRGDSVLWWMVNDPPQTITSADGQTTVGVSRYVSPDGYGVTAARVRVADEDDAFLPLYVSDGQHGWTLSDAFIADTVDEHGNWTGIDWQPASLGVSLGQFDSPQYSFLIELGYIDGGGNWTTLAVSDAYGRNSLANHISLGGVAVPGYTPWAPSFVVPEPSSGLLLLVGGALLSLRRKRRGVDLGFNEKECAK